MILLDTHVVIWFRIGDRSLGHDALGEVETALRQGNAAISAISFWEAGVRAQKGGLYFGRDLDSWREDVIRNGIIEIPVNGVIASRAALLTGLHGDPADRIIVATALEGHQLVTADDRILSWSGQLSRLDART